MDQPNPVGFPPFEPLRGNHPILGVPLPEPGWQYDPIARTRMFIESSISQGTQWVVFEPNNETLWAELRLNIGTFMQSLFERGDFQGTTPQQAYFVKCDADNNPPATVAMGIVNIAVGFAPLYPAEFVVIQIQQMAGQS